MHQIGAKEGCASIPVNDITSINVLYADYQRINYFNIWV